MKVPPAAASYLKISTADFQTFLSRYVIKAAPSIRISGMPGTSREARDDGPPDKSAS